jgi:hypothetical protein
MSDHYLQSVNQNKALVCKVCYEVSWVRGEEVLTLQRAFHICNKCEMIR